VTGGDARRSMG